jgi:probable HAF family extracellular repeat protein
MKRSEKFRLALQQTSRRNTHRAALFLTLSNSQKNGEAAMNAVSHVMRRVTLAVSLCIAYGVCTADAGAAEIRPARHFDVHYLTLDGAQCRVFDISDGRAVGWCHSPQHGAQRAFVWTQETGVVALGTLGGSSSSAAVAEGASVAGSSSTAGDVETHAFLARGGDMEDLGDLGGGLALPQGVHRSNVVGESTTATGDYHAFLATPASGTRDLGTLAAGTESSASAIHGGLIAGWSATDGFQIRSRRPVAWTLEGRMIDIAGEPIEFVEDGWVRGHGEANDVRNGLVVGYTLKIPALKNRAFIWTRTSGIRDLPLAPGSDENFAFATDGSSVVGQLSGFSDTYGWTTRAFVWTQQHGTVAITPPSLVAFATHVAAGRVLGQFSSNGARTFLWTRQHGLMDVTPSDFVSGAAPAGIDDQGRIAVVYTEEDPNVVRSAVLVPRRLSN